MENLLEVQNLKTHFPIRAGFFKKVINYVRAVDGVSFGLPRQETLALVGESGCGKSTIGRSILHLVPPTEGKVIFDRQDWSNLSPQELKKSRLGMQMIFQNSMSSLNPRMTVEQILVDAALHHQVITKKEARSLAIKLLEYVGMQPRHLQHFPHEFSGGQRQRICIARALSMQPKLLICDESVSALDVSIQAQILNLFKDLQDEFQMTYLFISHDMGVVRYIADRVIVMYLGRIVEIADTKKLFHCARHPYTKALLSAVPVTHPKNKKKRTLLTGDIPSPTKVYSGCPFAARCSEAIEACQHTVPQLKTLDKGHEVSCIRQVA